MGNLFARPAPSIPPQSAALERKEEQLPLRRQAERPSFNALNASCFEFEPQMIITEFILCSILAPGGNKMPVFLPTHNQLCHQARMDDSCECYIDGLGGWEDDSLNIRKHSGLLATGKWRHAGKERRACVTVGGLSMRSLD